MSHTKIENTKGREARWKTEEIGDKKKRKKKTERERKEENGKGRANTEREKENEETVRRTRRFY